MRLNSAAMTEEHIDLRLDPGARLDIVRVRCALSSRSQRRRSDHFHIIWVEHGHGLCEVDFVPQTLSPGRIFVIAPGQAYTWGDTRIQGRAFLFDPALLDRETYDRLMFGSGLFIPAAPRPVIDLTPRSPGDLVALASLVEGEFNSEPMDWAAIKPLLCAFASLVARASLSSHALSGHRQAARVSRLLKLIERHHIIERSPDFYAEAFGLSAKRINQITRQFLGRTVTQLVHDRIVLEAKRNLGVTDRDVQAVGHSLGFDDPSYFTRFFRRETGQTPIEFRSSVRISPQPSLPFDQAV